MHAVGCGRIHVQAHTSHAPVPSCRCMLTPEEPRVLRPGAPHFCFALGDACENKRNRRPLCREGAKEGCDPAGRRRGVHDDGEEDPVLGPQSPLPHTVVLLLSDPGK